MNEKTKDWHDTTFEPDHRYIIKKLMTGKIKWEITAFGSSKTFAACGNDFDEDGLLDCVGRVTEGTFEFHLNKITLRFLGTHSDGYWDYNVTQRYSGAAEGSVTPMMEIGRCSRI